MSHYMREASALSRFSLPDPARLHIESLFVRVSDGERLSRHGAVQVHRPEEAFLIDRGQHESHRLFCPAKQPERIVTVDVIHIERVRLLQFLDRLDRKSVV